MKLNELKSKVQAQFINKFSSYKSIPGQYHDMESEREKALNFILSFYYMALDKEKNQDKAIIYAVSQFVMHNYGFVEPISCDPRPYTEKAIDVIKKYGSDYNPFRQIVQATRIVK